MEINYSRDMRESCLRHFASTGCTKKLLNRSEKYHSFKLMLGNFCISQDYLFIYDVLLFLDSQAQKIQAKNVRK